MSFPHEFPSELSYKIFLDRYAQKDATRAFVVGDLAIAIIEPDPKWPKKDVGRVTHIDGEQLTITLETGPQAGDVLIRPRTECDRPLESTLAEVAQRIGHGIASVEPDATRNATAAQFAEEIRALRWIPGGRIWAGAGTDQELTYFNCFVIPSPKDSREGIVETLGHMIEIMSRGGGVGINVSSLRPTHAVVHGVNGRSSGAVSWMDLYSRATGLVEQGGSRRGALMLQLEDWHPDLPRFIAAKQTPGMVENANISVRLSDAFMTAVQADAPWDLVFPDTQDPDYDTHWDGNLDAWKAAGKGVVVYDTVPARSLWDAIIQGAWKAAEPGIVFSQRHAQDSNSWYFNPLVCTNPCVTGETRVTTTAGLVPIRELVGDPTKPDLVLDSRQAPEHPTAPLRAAWITGVRPVVKIITREGFQLRCTPDHRIRTSEGWCPAGQLTPNMHILILNRGGAFGTQGSEDLGRTLGWLVGNGTIKSDRAVLSFFHEKQDLAASMAQAVNRIIRPAVNHRAYIVHPVAVGETEQRVSSLRFREIADHHGLIPNKLQVPEVIFRGTEACQRGFLQALFSADGTVSHNTKKSRTIRLSSISRSLLEHVQQILLNFQIASRIYDHRRSGRTVSRLPDGHGSYRAYTVKPLYELEISKNNLQRFEQRIGFLLHSKRNTLQSTLSSYVVGPHPELFTAQVASVVPDGTAVVYDLTESLTHSFSGNGMIIANCAEQPLPAWGVCTLGHVNLAALYDAATHDVNWDQLRQTVHIGIRFLDDVVDATPYFYEANRANQQRERRVGLGTLGLGELLIRLGLRYGSPESIVFIDRLFRFIAQEAYQYDTVLAQEKGAFPAFDADLLLQSGFMQRMPESVREAIRQHGLRNVTLLTQAPTGTVGTMVGTSTGVEPFYALTYFRQSRLGFDPQYVEVAREWLEAHPGRPLPEAFVGAMDLTPEAHVRVQAAIQAWTDSSISKTANAPSTYTVEDTRQLYELAYTLGCKGVTIYRDQSRNEQVLHLTDSSGHDDAVVESSAPEACPATPSVLPVPTLVDGHTLRKETPAGTARVVINDVDGQPFEVFLLLGRAGSEVQSFMEALGRVISIYLRSQSPLDGRKKLALVADQLRGIGGANQMGLGPHRVLSVVDAIGQVLQQVSHVSPDASPDTSPAPHSEPTPQPVDAAPSYDLCPACAAPTLVYEEGCLHCVNPDGCGYSKC